MIVFVDSLTQRLQGYFDSETFGKARKSDLQHRIR